MEDTTPRLYKIARTDSRLNASTVGGGSSGGAGPSFLFAALAVPKLNATRASALLRGNVPCFNPALSTAYGKGVRELESTTEVEAQHEELRPEELCSLLASTGPLCALGVRTLLALAQASTAEGAGDVSLARTALDAALTVGALPLVFNVAANLAAELESETTSTVSSALSLMSAVVDLIANLCSAAVFPSDRSPGISAASQMRRLAAACAAMVRDAAYESVLGTAIADIEVSIAAKLIDAFYFIELHPMTNPDMPDDVYANEFASGTFLAALLQLLTATSCTPRATSFAKVLHYGSNYYEFNISLAFNVPTLTSHSGAVMGAGASAGGAGAISSTHMFDAVKYVLNALSSTSHDDSTMLELLSCVGNLMIEGGGVSVTPGGSSAVRDPSWLMRLLLDKDALSELQPSILSSNPAVSLDAAYTVMGLASWPDAAEAVNKSGVIALVQDVLRTVPPGSVTFAHTQWGANDVPNLLARLQPDSHSAVHLATLGSLCATLSRERNFNFISGPLISNAVRALAATDDPFVFSSVIFILRALKMPLPTFRAKRVSESLSLGLNPEAWGIDQVVAWAGQFPFGVYRGVFRTGMVCGKVLLSLTEKDLADNGIEHSLHRKSILYAIADLKAAYASPAPGGPSAPIAALKAKTYDVFISYRRAGGADFAHLLKMCLTANGLEVFLDVENIGTGSFADVLDKSMLSARNVVLVWSRGCMDRFLNGADPQNQDFVRREYALALQLKKNIVPVTKSDFEFPSEEHLPHDVRSILGFNAVKWVAEYREASLDKLKAALI